MRDFFKQFIWLFILFIVVFGVTNYSRNARLNNPKALVFDDFSLTLNHKIPLDSLIAKIDTLTQLNSTELKWAAKLYGWRNFLEGHYTLDGAYSYDAFLSKLGKGLQDPVRFTVKAGYNPWLMSKSLSKSFKADSLAFLDAIQDTVAAQRAGLTAEEWYGRLLPDTYEMYWQSKPSDIIKKIHQNFKDKIVVGLASAIDSSKYDITEILALASIVEWEAGVEDEKPRIAGLYVNRLNKRIRLQADPTVLFAVGQRRRVLYQDLKIDHPYNTYRHYGLPPGPITNPSISSIKAALYPEKHAYIFMVAEPGATGRHIFTKSYKEHLNESRKWRGWLDEQYRIKREKERQQMAEED